METARLGLHEAPRRTRHLAPDGAPSVTHRVALHTDGDRGNRVIRVLQTDPGVEIGRLRTGPDSEGPPGSVAGWDVLAVDALTAACLPLVEEACDLGLPVVVAADLPARFAVAPDATIVGGAASGAGLAAALALSMLPRSAEPVKARLAWTVAGRPLRAGRAVTFPEPVGSLWAGWGENPLPWPDVACCPAPTDSAWKAVRVDLEFRDAEGGGSVVHGVSDEARFLDAACFGSAILAAARGAYPRGAGGPGDPDGVFVRLAQDAGMQVARFVAA